ncbi:lipoprotein [Neisseria wadsworthii 9715]|uniref:Lipoprotein n=2 Tax=Neisseria TaxID=482 RepID=G4CRR8_9NEIS|nr:lipoprotein [Neisseria wadsworthii 9715]
MEICQRHGAAGHYPFLERINMKIKSLLSVAAVLTLAACVVPVSNQTPSHDHSHHHGHSQAQSGAATQFTCQNGLSVQVRQLSDSKIELTLDDKRAVLTQTRSASGELYTANKGLFGSGAQWHSKGGEAFFSFADPYGNKVETSCNAM